MREKILECLLKKNRNYSAASQDRVSDIVRRLDDGLLKFAASKEEYLNLATLESCLLVLTRRLREETNFNGADAQREDELRETPLHEGTSSSAGSNNDIGLDDVADKHQSPPIRARPSGKKKRQNVKRNKQALRHKVV